MSNRHLSRTIAMQTLYQWDFLGNDQKDINAMLAFNREEFASNFDDGGFAEELVAGVLANQKEIDELIAQFAPHWPLESLTLVDRNILRLGIYELKLSPNVPSKVAINEAIELAKGFGGGSSGKFVNGVLGAIYKDMVEKNQLKDVDKSGEAGSGSAGEDKKKEEEQIPAPTPSESEAE
ncbi:transcription antitermination factor NusB [Patescibacteria group bacterium]|nr:transcription antitermination factor NusB [Patescibacteria group bacterium]MBU1705291.1 transcription antitermination factor NusB [Patescibacteria group bacterium]